MAGRVRRWFWPRWRGVATWWIGRTASAALRSWALPSFRAGEAAGEFTDVGGGDQPACGGVTAWRHGPVIAGCAAAPDPPPRVLALEPLQLGILIVPASAGGHGVSPQAAGGRPGGCGCGRARAWMAGCATGISPSETSSPAFALPALIQPGCLPVHPQRHAGDRRPQQRKGHHHQAALPVTCCHSQGSAEASATLGNAPNRRVCIRCSAGLGVSAVAHNEHSWAPDRVPADFTLVTAVLGLTARKRGAQFNHA
jgi:hypothetical protein